MHVCMDVWMQWVRVCMYMGECDVCMPVGMHVCDVCMYVRMCNVCHACNSMCACSGRNVCDAMWCVLM